MERELYISWQTDTLLVIKYYCVVVVCTQGENNGRVCQSAGTNHQPFHPSHKSTHQHKKQFHTSQQNTTKELWGKKLKPNSKKKDRSVRLHDDRCSGMSEKKRLSLTYHHSLAFELDEDGTSSHFITAAERSNFEFVSIKVE